MLIDSVCAKAGVDPDERASVDRTDQIPDGGASFKRRSGKFAANPSVLDYLRMPVAKEKPRLCRTWVGAIRWVQHWVQLARSLEVNFGIKRCRINGKCES
jgi:hypothetical protein